MQTTITVDVDFDGLLAMLRSIPSMREAKPLFALKFSLDGFPITCSTVEDVFSLALEVLNEETAKATPNVKPIQSGFAQYNPAPDAAAPIVPSGFCGTVEITRG